MVAIQDLFCLQRDCSSALLGDIAKLSLLGDGTQRSNKI